MKELLPLRFFAQNGLDSNEYCCSSHDIGEAWIEINLACIENNIAEINKFTGNKPILAVVKNNSYGHGMVAIAKTLVKLGVFGVCTGKLSEALELRNSGLECPILNLGPFTPQEAELIVSKKISQSVFNQKVDLLAQAAKKMGMKAKVHIKIDTGLGRVGIRHENALAFLEKISEMENIKIEGTFTTMTEAPDFDIIQIKRFSEVCEKAERKGILIGLRHAAASGSVLNNADAYFDMIRPGISIFGFYPNPEELTKRRIDLKPALSLKTRVSCIKQVKAGESISYRRVYVAQTTETIATASIGYSDGFYVDNTKEARAIINGRLYPLAGFVTSNQVLIRIMDDTVHLGDEVTLIGSEGVHSITVEQIISHENISHYRFLTNLNPQLPRYYKSLSD